jgi:SAM-dependent methyltransferase
VTLATNDLQEFFANLDVHTSTGGLTHRAHPYPAKFIPQIPSELIRTFSAEGETVLDPMCGSGTTLVEAIVNRRSAIGVDINPISALVTEAKTTPLTSAELGELLDLARAVESGYVPATIETPEFLNLNHWFEAEVIVALSQIRAAIAEMPSDRGKLLARCTFSAILVGVSNQDSETRWTRVERSFSAREVRQKFVKHLRADMQDNVLLAQAKPAPARTILADARSLPLESSSVDLVVTSPPYANSHDYYLYNKLRMFWLGYDVKATQAAEIGSRNKHSDMKLDIGDYLTSMAAVMEETNRVLRPGRVACVVVGDAVIRKEFFDMGQQFGSIALQAGLRPVAQFSFGQQRFTRAFTRGFGTEHAKLTHVLVYTSS